VLETVFGRNNFERFTMTYATYKWLHGEPEERAFLIGLAAATMLAALKGRTGRRANKKQKVSSTVALTNSNCRLIDDFCVGIYECEDKIGWGHNPFHPVKPNHLLYEQWLRWRDNLAVYLRKTGLGPYEFYKIYLRTWPSKPVTWEEIESRLIHIV